MRLLDLDALEPAELDEWGWLLREEAARKRRRLAELSLGRTIGWHRRNTPGRARTAPPRTMTPAQVTRLVAGMTADSLPEAPMVEATVALAVESGLGQPIAECAAARGVEIGRQEGSRGAA